MAKIIGLPKLSPTMEEGTLVAWTKAEGDKIDVDELLAEVETDKATMEFRSFDKGVLLKILVPEGRTLAPDTPVAIIGKAGEDISALLAEVEKGGGSAGGATSAPTVEAAPAAKSAPTEQAFVEAPTAVASTAAATEVGGRILSSPVVRKLARERGVDLATVQGSGPRGRIVKRDIEESPAGGVSTARGVGAPIGAPLPRGERLPPLVEVASSTRKTIARRLSESKREIPHYYLTIDVDAEPVWQARTQINADLEASGEKVSVNDLIIKAAALALRRVPGANASWQDGNIVTHRVVDISVAVAISDGLITPVVRDADQKGVLTISREVKELAARAKQKKLRLEEISGGTFSISNLGMYGIEEFAAVINPPEGAILAIGSVRQEPVVVHDKVVPGRRMKMTLSADHRVIDGALGAQYLAALKSLLESPLTMLL